MALFISHTARSYPKHPYEEMKNAILGKAYTLSLTFVGEKRAQDLNKAHRNASYIPNVLSFPLDSNVGEIYITPVVAAKEAHKFNLSTKGYVAFLFIHGLLHLKGYPHGATMDRAEQKYIKLFGIR